MRGFFSMFLKHQSNKITGSTLVAKIKKEGNNMITHKNYYIIKDIWTGQEFKFLTLADASREMELNYFTLAAAIKRKGIVARKYIIRRLEREVK